MPFSSCCQGLKVERNKLLHTAYIRIIIDIIMAIQHRERQNNLHHLVNIFPLWNDVAKSRLVGFYGISTIGRLFNAKSSFYIYIRYIWFGLVVLYGISTIVGYLMLNLVFPYILNIWFVNIFCRCTQLNDQTVLFLTIQFSISQQS